MRPWFLLVCLFGIVAAYAQNTEHILYLVGDAGESGPEHSQPVLDLVRQVSATDGAKARTLLFLGDNIYDDGLHETGHKDRTHDERNIDVQVQLMKDFNGDSHMVAGNHDWHQGREQGLDYLRREEEYVENALGSDVFAPQAGNAGPVEIPLGDKAVMLLIDTQWWLQAPNERGGALDGRGPDDEEAVLAELERIIGRDQGHDIIVAGHHPFFTYGSHGGHFPLREHLFPLTAKWPWAWLPLPGIASIYPLYRSCIGATQDVRRGRYHDLASRAQALFARHPGLVYVAGHEHALQYSVHDAVHHLVSGAGSKRTWVKRSKELVHASDERGFARIRISGTGGMTLEFYTLRGGAVPVFSGALGH